MMMVNNKYDVIIAGGGTSGISCAWNCGKLGLETLLVERNSFLGGSITSSLVIPAMKTSENAINTDFYDNFYNNLKNVSGAITYSDGNRGWFNPELTKIILDSMMKDANVDVLFESCIGTIQTEKDKILSLTIDTIYNDNLSSCPGILSQPIETNYLVDATGDSEIFQKLNLEFLKKNENDFQPINLRFIMSGVNTKKFAEWITKFDTDREVTTACTEGGYTYVSTAYTWDTNKNWALRPIFRRAVEDNVLKEEDTNYFQLFSVAGTQDSIAFNAPRLINTGLNRSDAYIDARSAIFRLSNFCKKYLKGFENSYISSIANTLGVRVSNRIRGKYVYSYDDLVSGKTFDRPVLVSNYPIDIHSDKKDSSTLQKVYKEYQLPLESLMSADYENLFAIGRCISADFRAQAALRIIPSCFSMGEGLAKYLAEIKH